ncbi:hypothetical protein ACFQV8_10915 [Pseudonocardia benzenivorans]
MEQDQAWVVIAQQRRALADLLDDLTPRSGRRRRCASGGGSATWPPTWR